MAPPAGLDEFLRLHGWEGAIVAPVAGDASFRRYFRVESATRGKAILMDAPPPHEDPRPFIHIAQYLNGHQFRAPEIFATDLTRGLLLIEDFGDRRMREHLDENPEDEAAVYRAAIDAIVRLAQTPAVQAQPYDMATYMREVQLLSEWYMPAMGISFDASAFDQLWTDALAPLADYQKVTVLRDYHAENIMLLDDGQQGIIDFQDALVGHPAYDLVSLLQDARRDVSPALEAEMLAYYHAVAKPGADFDAHYALLGAQRNTKIIGIFTRLWKRDGKERYLSFLPRMWALLERDLAHPDLAPVKLWFDTFIPSDVRHKLPTELNIDG
ncbi:aminoglycoside phosphotransferase family protein [Sphingorhabdus wooponensis]|uniref:Aminoglycoside phosphotransferase n=1 Tax=Sphingorhabdus wooponensis TaxID=940136 RepID=A0A3R8WKI3_9SPHN|nr:phosphotransferase [Sphingorhabdus wooponensis]RRQ52081.1 aminoglycoside phosphotransferase [Sphingorhabdus wooponensis]